MEDVATRHATHSERQNLSADVRAALARGEESTMASVVLRNVTKAWGDTVVSNDINLEMGSLSYLSGLLDAVNQRCCG